MWTSIKTKRVSFRLVNPKFIKHKSPWIVGCNSPAQSDYGSTIVTDELVLKEQMKAMILHRLAYFWAKRCNRVFCHSFEWSRDTQVPLRLLKIVGVDGCSTDTLLEISMDSSMIVDSSDCFSPILNGRAWSNESLEHWNHLHFQQLFEDAH